jgi:uncharacterized protein
VKYLLLLLIVLAVLWRIRSKLRVPDSPQTQEQAEPVSKTVEMHACTHCGLHMPFSDMVAGTRGRYCTDGHRSLAEH